MSLELTEEHVNTLDKMIYEYQQHNIPITVGELEHLITVVQCHHIDLIRDDI